MMLLTGSFKPYYNWNTFNTESKRTFTENTSYCFKPYYNWNTFNTITDNNANEILLGFKPYYNWNTFNT